MYKVLEHFTDLQDNRFEYNPGDEFPREGLKVSDERIKELSTDQNKRHRPVIEIIKETVKVEEKVEKKAEPKAEKPVRKTTRKRTKKSAD